MKFVRLLYRIIAMSAAEVLDEEMAVRCQSHSGIAGEMVEPPSARQISIQIQLHPTLEKPAVFQTE